MNNCCGVKKRTAANENPQQSVGKYPGIVVSD